MVPANALPISLGDFRESLNGNAVVTFGELPCHRRQIAIPDVPYTFSPRGCSSAAPQSGGIAQLVERQLCKLDVRGSNPLASISKEMEAEMRAAVRLVGRVTRKGSNPATAGSFTRASAKRWIIPLPPFQEMEAEMRTVVRLVGRLSGSTLPVRLGPRLLVWRLAEPGFSKFAKARHFRPRPRRACSPDMISAGAPRSAGEASALP